MTGTKGIVTVVAGMLAVLALAQPTHAKTIKVGNGTAASCTEAALRNAVTFAQGERRAVIKFNCGGGAVTIAVTQTLTVPDDTTIDGAGLITLDGQFGEASGLGPIFRIERASTVALRGLTVQGGFGCAGSICNAPAGGGVHNEGSLQVNGCTFSDNHGGEYGGGIYNSGTLEVHASTFSHNEAPLGGGGIFSQGTLTIDGSMFTGNTGTFGGAIFAEGALAVRGTAFSGNGGHGKSNEGGALRIGTGTHTISSSVFTQNIADENSGAIAIVGGTLTVKDSTISQSEGHFGGAIDVRGTLTIKRSRVSGNHGSSGGGILNEGTLVVEDSTITDNVADDRGGGIENAGALTVKDSAITRNAAAVDGGGIYKLSGTLQLKGDAVVARNAPNDIAP